jgi:hypothetical protein
LADGGKTALFGREVTRYNFDKRKTGRFVPLLLAVSQASPRPRRNRRARHFPHDPASRIPGRIFLAFAS